MTERETALRAWCKGAVVGENTSDEFTACVESLNHVSLGSMIDFLRVTWARQPPGERFATAIALAAAIFITAQLIIHIKAFKRMTAVKEQWSKIVLSQMICENILVYTALLIQLELTIFKLRTTNLACASPIMHLHLRRHDNGIFSWRRRPLFVPMIFVVFCFGTRYYLALFCQYAYFPIMIANQSLVLAGVCDRLYALNRPLKYKRGTPERRAKVANLLSYGVAFLVAALLIGWRLYGLRIGDENLLFSDLRLRSSLVRSSKFRLDGREAACALVQFYVIGTFYSPSFKNWPVFVANNYPSRTLNYLWFYQANGVEKWTKRNIPKGNGNSVLLYGQHFWLWEFIDERWLCKKPYNETTNHNYIVKMFYGITFTVTAFIGILTPFLIRDYRKAMGGNGVAKTKSTALQQHEITVTRTMIANALFVMGGNAGVLLANAFRVAMPNVKEEVNAWFLLQGPRSYLAVQFSAFAILLSVLTGGAALLPSFDTRPDFLILMERHSKASLYSYNSTNEGWGACRDRAEGCADWAWTEDCMKHAESMSLDCPFSCGLCDKEGDVLGCRDRSRLCRDWAAKGECTLNPRFVLPNCPRSCGVCGQTLVLEDTESDNTTSSSTCRDFAYFCPIYIRDGNCEFHEAKQAYFRTLCPFSCHNCLEPGYLLYTLGKCKDFHGYCDERTKKGECQDTATLPVICPESCGFNAPGNCSHRNSSEVG